MALAQPKLSPTTEPLLAAQRIRRCVFRRITTVDRRRERIYDVECLFPRSVPMPLGDLESATPICNACAAPGTFRADED